MPDRPSLPEPGDLLQAMPLEHPYRPTVLRWLARNGEAPDPVPLVEWWSGRRVGYPAAGWRYPWDIPVARWLPEDQLRAWRPSEATLARDEPDAYAARLWMPTIALDSVEWLAEDVARRYDGVEPDRDDPAVRLLADVEERINDELAKAIATRDPWGDTFLLWVLARRPRTLERHVTLGEALATRYATLAGATGGLVQGVRFPFFGVAMPSATAHVAAAVALLGVGRRHLPAMITALGRARNRDGTWGDPGQPGDALSTIAAVDLFASLDPSFDTQAALRALDRTPEAQRGWAAIGPELPFLAAEVASLRDRLALPFAERFRWPHVPDRTLDLLTRLPVRDAFEGLAELFGCVKALGDEELDLAYLDLAGFHNWNNRNGMTAGDNVLVELAVALREIPDARAFRIGGDEFLVVGAPGRRDLKDDLHAFAAAWPGRVTARFGAVRDPVAPRILVQRRPASTLRDGMEVLGKELGGFKRMNPHPPPTGAIDRIPLELTGFAYTQRPPARHQGPPRIYLVRHGKTAWNADGRLLSRTDEPLTDTGKAEAQHLGEKLSLLWFDRVIVSPRVRASRTAELIVDGARTAERPAIVPDERLVELDFGPYEGWTEAQLAADPVAAAWRAGAATAPGVEPDEEAAARIGEWFCEISAEPGLTLVVGHGRLFQILLAVHVLGLPANAARVMRMRTCRPAVVEPGTPPLLLGLNLEGHLPEVG
jgi:broad specificity phosphatase PhoE/GGDEF domain-containing protein